MERFHRSVRREFLADRSFESPERAQGRDMVVLTRDIMTIPEEEILEAQVAHTILGGKIVYGR